MYDTLAENSELKDKAKTDTDILTDTLSVNQVLMEEIKVKDAIIEANEKLSKTNEDENRTSNDQTSAENGQNHGNNVTQWIKCDKCEWKSTEAMYLAGHMLKHTGQYICAECNSSFMSNNDLKIHHEEHHTSIQKFNCSVCDKNFITEPSFSQHMNSKHKSNNRNLPVGHPERLRTQEKVSHQQMKFACAVCGYRFQLPGEVEEHVREHHGDERFETQNRNRICRYFKRGFCAKGDQCAYQHK